MPEAAGLARRAKALAVRAARLVLPDVFLVDEGEDQVLRLGHRAYVGGQWEEIGASQLAFLREQGLQPGHVLLDVACGALRLGSKAIPFLDRGHYLGVDREAALIEAGIRDELPAGLLDEKQPELLVSDSFAFDRLSRKADFAVAFSLFTHLVPADIDRCLQAMRRALQPDAVFFVSYIPRPLLWRNPTRSNAFAAFCYSPTQMKRFGQQNGFAVEILGPFRPGGQHMAAFRQFKTDRGPPATA